MYHWKLARAPHAVPMASASTAVGMLRGSFPKPKRITLTISNDYAYKFRYLHRGLTQLALLGSIQYKLKQNDDLGRKTAIIRLSTEDHEQVTAVIDSGDRPYQLGNPDLDLDRVFEDQPRVLIRLTYSEDLFKPGLLERANNPIFTRSSGRHGAPGKPIGRLYQQVVDGAYWPINERFLDERWVKQQRQRTPPPRYDLMGLYTLRPPDLPTYQPDQALPISERYAFLLQAAHLEDEHALSLKVGTKLSGEIHAVDLPDPVRRFILASFLDYETYLDALVSSRLQFCPKNFWQEDIAVGNGNRTYRLMENLALGRVCISSPVKLHFAFEPGIHYLEVAADLSDLEEVVMRALAHPDELAKIRNNVLELYEKHLSPIAVARHYVGILEKLLRGEIPLSAWDADSGGAETVPVEIGDSV